MNDSVHFDFSTLWPQFQTLLQGQVSSAEGISALVIGLLWVLFAGFLLVNVVWASWRARRAVGFFRELLRDMTPDTVLARRQELANRVANVAAQQAHWRELWEAFDATLVVSPDTGQLRSTYDAASLFNPQSLARGITESRLLAAVPGFLTALGVIGTFAGLFLGLADIDLKELNTALLGINRLVDGAAIAFKTSVWGVTLSVTFNVIEKSVEQRVRRWIAALQERIDALFPHLSPEQTLMYIHEEMRQATGGLDGLAERIGARVEDAVTRATQHFEAGIVQGMHQVLAPAIESLVQAAQGLADRQAREGTEALERLVRQFSEGMTGQGDAQRTMMQQAAEAVTQAIDQWRVSMADFLTRLEAQHALLETRDTARAAVLDQHLQASQIVVNQSEDVRQSLAALAHSLETSATELRAGGDHLQHATGGLHVLAEALQGGANRLDRTLQQAVGQTRSLLEENAATGRQIREVLGKLGYLQDALSTAAESVVAATTTSSEQTAQLVHHQQHLFKALEAYVKRLQQQMGGLMSEYAEQVQKQTHERLNQWNVQTQQFAETMESVVQSIASVVEEIEVKLGK
jgi:ABC-type transporter Mla subunit MlaD